MGAYHIGGGEGGCVSDTCVVLRSRKGSSWRDGCNRYLSLYSNLDDCGVNVTGSAPARGHAAAYICGKAFRNKD